MASAETKSEEKKEVILKTEDASGSYLWEIENTEQVSHFIEAENGKRLKSLPFSVGKLQWLLESFPNGDTESNIGSFMVYLTLIKIPDDWQSVTFLLRIFNTETGSSFTGIATYTKTSNSGGWSDGTLLLNDLKLSIKEYNKNKISLGCRIRILQLMDKSNNKLYEHPLPMKYINIMKSQNPIFNIKWIINDKLLKKFKCANIGKKFESEIFECWSLRCAPNGKRENDKGNIKLYLLLCALPPTIIHCKIKYTLYCDEINIKWTNIRDFSYKYPNVGWPNGTMLYNELNTKYKHLTQLTFRADIIVLKLYTEHDILSEEDDDDSDSDSDSSSYDSDNNKNNNENDEFQSIAKKSDMKRRESHEIKIKSSLISHLQRNVPKINSKATHLRQETDMNVTASPHTPGIQMRSRKITDINLLHEFMSYNGVGNNRDRNATVIERQVSDDEYKDEMMLEYNERLRKLENNFKQLSSKLNDISLSLEDLSKNNYINCDHNLYTIMDAMKKDICLIKYKLMDDKDLNEKQEKIKNWLTQKVELLQYFDVFVVNGLDDFVIIKHLNDNDLITIGINKLGHRKKILHYIQML